MGALQVEGDMLQLESGVRNVWPRGFIQEYEFSHDWAVVEVSRKSASILVLMENIQQGSRDCHGLFWSSQLHSTDDLMNKQLPINFDLTSREILNIDPKVSGQGALILYVENFCLQVSDCFVDWLLKWIWNIP